MRRAVVFAAWVFCVLVLAAFLGYVTRPGLPDGAHGGSTPASQTAP